MTQMAVASTAGRNSASVDTGPLPERLFGYNVMRRLGQGAGSQVYAVCKPGSAELYALKLVQRQAENDDRFVDQLSNEYAVSRQFKAPGLRRCPLLRLKRGWGFKVVEAALMMDYIDGEAMGVNGLPPGPSAFLPGVARGKWVISAAILKRSMWICSSNWRQWGSDVVW